MEVLLIKHGFFQLAIGTLAGMPYVRVISKKKNNQEQWRIAHLAGILGGIMLIALGCAYPYYKNTSNYSELMIYGFIISNWIFTLGLLISGFSGKRGLSPKTKSPVGKILFGLYGLAALISSLSAFLLIHIGIQL